jgi:hypothetical protein
MPTTITSAGITFNDATSLTSGVVGTANLANNSVTAAKLGSTERLQLCKAWVNFNGTRATSTLVNLSSGDVITATSGGNTVSWFSSGAGWVAGWVGEIIQFSTISGSSSGTLGGVTAANLRLQVTAITNTNNATLTLVSGAFSSTQSITGNGTSSVATYFNSGIRSSYNVSSISKNGTGDYTVNLVAGAVADASYSIALSRSYQNGSTGGTIGESTSATRTATTVRVYTFTVGGSAQDDPLISLQIFGN